MIPAVAFDRAGHRSGASGAAAALVCLAVLLSATVGCGASEAPPPGSRERGEVEVDEATLEALRSLGYLASGHGKQAPPETGEVPFRIVSFTTTPSVGTRAVVVRNLVDWNALFSNGEAPALDADFGSEMAVVMPIVAEGEVPSGWKVVSVVMTADAVRIECRSEPLEKRGDVEGRGQVVLIPTTDLPVQLVTP